MKMTRAENFAIAEAVYPGISSDIKKIKVNRGSRRVFRLAPSPTGEMHIGTLLISVINFMLVLKEKGIFILRIEDTDQKREMNGATQFIYSSLAKYGIKFQEGPEIGGKAGPYIQSMRRTLYHCCAKKMLQDGTAYIDFQTSDELNAIRIQQEKRGIPIGSYGGFSKWRNANFEQVKDAFQSRKPYVIRYYNPNPYNTKKRNYNDAIRGKMELAPYIWDEVIIKSDGLPTYHAAHVWDDVLMGVTDVFRGSDWINSLDLHLQLYNAFGFKTPNYGHIPTINKKVGLKVDKLSKRSDPEASLRNYDIWGIPKLAVLEYLMGISSPKFEDWRKKNPAKMIWDFPLNENDLKKKQGPVIDFQKIYSISKEVIMNFSSVQLLKEYSNWSSSHYENFYQILQKDIRYTQKVFSIGKGTTNRRKDISNYTQVQYYLGNMYDEIFYNLPKGGKSSISENKSYYESSQIDLPNDISRKILTHFHNNISKNGIPSNAQQMLAFFKDVPIQIGTEVSLNSILKVVRVSLFGRTETPDLFEILSVLGKEKTLSRIKYLYNTLK